jgi:hypothetical protein
MDDFRHLIPPKSNEKSPYLTLKTGIVSCKGFKPHSILGLALNPLFVGFMLFRLAGMAAIEREVAGEVVHMASTTS